MSFRQFVFFASFATVAVTGYLLWEGYAFFRSEFPDVSRLKSQYPHLTYQGREQPARVTMHRSRPDTWVSLGEVSKVAVGAIVVSEDWAFFQHNGFDANQIKEAIKEDLQEGRFARGASTLTQQVVKNVFLERDKNLWRKLKELILAVRLESSVGKRRILEVYLNIAEWGEGIYGIGQASRYYFQKYPSQLTAKEGAFLAMLLPSPKRYSQSYRNRQLTDYARDTIDSILGKMGQARYLTEEELLQARESRLPFEAVAEAPPATPTQEDPVPSSELPPGQAT